MEIKKTIQILKDHNEWRRNDNVPNSKKMVNVYELGEAIDNAIFILELILKSKPTRFSKNNLPNDVKIEYNKATSMMFTIENYELGVITEDEFIMDVRNIRDRFKL